MRRERGELRDGEGGRGVCCFYVGSTSATVDCTGIRLVLCLSRCSVSGPVIMPFQM